MRFKQNPLTRLTVKVTNRQRLVFAGFCMAVGLLVGGVTFLLINFGNNTKSFAALGSNMGFENGTTEWTAVSGTWTSNTTASYVRTGTKSLAVSVSSGPDVSIKNTSSTISPPNGGSYKLVVIAWVKASASNAKVRVGVVNTSNNTTTMNSTYTDVTTTGFTRVTTILSSSNNSTFIPVIAAKVTGTTTNVYVDDVIIYYTTNTSADLITPNAPSGISASTSGTTNTLNWTNGGDNESGIDGITILRTNTANVSDVSLNDQAVYSATSSIVGPTSIGSWTIVYHGNSITSYADNPGSAGAYTYLIYMRDKANNYTASTSAARIMIVNGTNTTIAVSSNISVDGLYVASGCTLTANSSVTVSFRAGGVANIYGTLIDIGAFSNTQGATVNMQSGSVYKYNKSNSYSNILSANWLTGSTLTMCGAFQSNSIPGMNQTFYNVTWNSPNQAQFQDIPSGFQATGDLNFIDSGPGNSDRVIWFNGTIHIKGNLYCSSASDIRFRDGSNIIFDGSAIQTINIASGYSPTWNAITIDNPTSVKILHPITVDSMVYMSSGTFDMNSYTVYLKNNCTVVRGLGSFSNGSYQPVNASDVYNLEYLRGGYTTGNELTSSTTYLNNLIMNTPSETVTLDKTANVNGTLTLNTGKIQTGSYEVYVRNSAASAVVVNGTTCYIYGNLRRNILNSGSLTYEFPIGSSTNPEFATLVLNNLLTTTNILGSFSTTITGSAPNCWINVTNVNYLLNCGIWTMTPNTQPTGGTYDITVKGKGYTNPAITADRYGVIKRDNSSSVWKSLGTHVNNTQSMIGGVVTAKRSALTSFSDFGIAYGNYVLPITLSAFNATLQSGKVNINWTTSAEINNAYFSLERSTNGVNFEMINEQSGQGTSTTQHNYSYTDEHPFTGNNYYRLKQVDFDGTFTYSPIRQVSVTELNSNSPSTEITVYPNPGNGLFTFGKIVTSGIIEKATVQVFDLKGQLILQETFTGNDLVKIDLTSQPPGVYMATVTDANNQSISKQLVIQR